MKTSLATFILLFWAVQAIAEVDADSEVTTNTLIEDSFNLVTKSSTDPKMAALYIEFDITGVASDPLAPANKQPEQPPGKARIYKFGKLVDEYTISGGRRRLETNKRKQKTCTFTTTGLMKPTLLQNPRKSKDWGSQMQFFVGFDMERGVGAHQGDLGGNSGGCVRQDRAKAKALYEEVKKVSQLSGDHVQSTNAVFNVIDNTPGIAEAQKKCLDACNRSGSCSTPYVARGKQPVLSEETILAAGKRPRPKPEVIKPELKPTVSAEMVETPVKAPVKPAKAKPKPAAEAASDKANEPAEGTEEYYKKKLKELGVSGF